MKKAKENEKIMGNIASILAWEVMIVNCLVAGRESET